MSSLFLRSGALVCILFLILSGCVAGGFTSEDKFRVQKELTAAIPQVSSSNQVSQVLIASFNIESTQIQRHSFDRPDRWIRDGREISVTHCLEVRSFRVHRHLLSPGLVDFITVLIYFDSQDRFVEVLAEVSHGK